jgi:hypothetical protein
VYAMRGIEGERGLASAHAEVASTCVQTGAGRRKAMHVNACVYLAYPASRRRDARISWR